MTSSARASTVAGMSMPSALAVLRLIASSYLVGAHRKVGGVLTLEDAIDVAGGLPELIDGVGPIGNKAAVANDVSHIVDRGQLVASCQRDDEITMHCLRRAPGDYQSAVRGTSQTRDGALHANAPHAVGLLRACRKRPCRRASAAINSRRRIRIAMRPSHGGHATGEDNITPGRAALRDFKPACVGSGSKGWIVLNSIV